jgi:localization factor PodJL
MTSGVPWQAKGVRREVIDSAREAARRSGMSVEEWLDTVIAESARNAGVEPATHRLSDIDDYASRQPAAGSFADVGGRLAAIARQVDHLTQVRQRMLDSGAAAAPMDLPRAPNQRLPDLEQQLRQINARIEAMRPCGLDGAVGALRNDLAEIGMMLKEAMPRQAIEALESEIRSLASRIDHERHAGLSGQAMAGVERGLAEVRDALHALTPAESLVGFDQAVQGLSQKIDRLAGAGPNSEALKQLEGAIVALRGVVSHVASNDALAQLSDDVRALSAKVDQVTAPGAFAAMEQRIAAIADALQQSRGVRAADAAGLETAVRSLADKIDQLHANHSDRTEDGDREERTVRLAEKLDASEVAFASSEPALFLPDILPGPPVAPSEPAASLEPSGADAPAAARANPSLISERRPIDPNLPPDHPLEPGAGRSRGDSPADRIAASEAALENVRPPVIPDPGSKSNFIAAARRAAQAAMVEATPSKDGRGSDSAGGDAGKSLTDTLGGRIRKLVVGASVVLFVLGALHFAATHLWFDATPSEEPITTTSVEVISDQTLPADEPPSLTAPAASDRQSAALPPAISIAPNALGIGIEVPPPAPAAASIDGEATSSIPQPAAQAAAPPAAPRPLPQTRPPSAPPPRGTPADRLPPGIGSGLRTAAAHGDPAAEFEVATRFADGRGVPQNLPEAAAWFERAANKGLIPAQFRLGGLYEKGTGVQKNLDTARRLYVGAAEAGHAKAMHNLAVLYAEGIDGKPNYATAARWFRRAADHGVIDSQYNLAVLYARGIGVETNLAEAFKWFALASRDGDRDAAKRRDDVAARLDRQSLAAAMAAAQSWQPVPQPDAATQVRVPPGGWDGMPSAAKRTAGPKVDKQSRHPAQ